MLKKRLLGKGLAVGVILLFIGIAFAPGINVSVVKASSDDDFIEVSSEACGIKGFGNTTVKLTKQQYQSLEQYLVEFRERLNKTTIREEAIPIFNEAVVELNKYGLLPKGMSVELAQKLATGEYQNKKIVNSLEKIINKNKSIFTHLNLFCLVAGRTNNTFSYHSISTLLLYGGWGMIGLGFLLGIIVFSKTHSQYLGELVTFAIVFWGFLLFILWEIITRLVDINPLAIFEILTIGYFDYWNRIGYGNGWVQSIGLLGSKKWNGNLTGIIPIAIVPLDELFITKAMPAIYGFNGIKIYESYQGTEKYYFGSALAIGIDVQQ